MKILDAIVKTGLTPTRNEARRLIYGRTVALNDKLVLPENDVDIKLGDVIQLGRRVVTITEEHLKD